MIIPVTDLSHPGLQPYAHLTEAQLRNRLEPDQGIFIAESPKVIRVALDAGYKPVSLLTEEKHITGQAADLVARLDSLPIYTGSRELLASLTGQRIVLVDNVVNSTNTGAILRAAAALGMDGILFTTTCCDPLNRRSVRVSMGTVFQIPWTYIPSWPRSGMEMLHAMGFKTVALALSPKAVPIDHPGLVAEERLVLVLGTEGDGLSQQTIDDCDYQAIIPMQRGVDSLNVAAAAAVAFWQLRKA